jgi:hypothetical protein
MNHPNAGPISTTNLSCHFFLGLANHPFCVEGDQLAPWFVLEPSARVRIRSQNLRDRTLCYPDMGGDSGLG